MGSPKKSPTKKKARRVAKPRAYPSSSAMVQAAIAALKERRGSSLAAIKKYIAANYKCDMTRMNVHIRNAIRTGVAKGTLVQVKGQGASGSFRLAVKRVDPAKAQARKAAAAKRRAAAVAKRRARRAATKAKRAAAKAKKAAAAKAKRAAKKSKSKAKKRTAKKTAKPKKKAAPKKKRAAPKKAKKTAKPKPKRRSPKKAARKAPKKK